MATDALNSISQILRAGIGSENIKESTSLRESKSPDSECAKNFSGFFFDDQNIDELVDNINKFLSSVQTELKVEIHSKTRTPIFKIVRKYDNKVIQEVPPSKLLDLKASLEKIAGVLLNIHA